MTKIDIQAWLKEQRVSADSYNANELLQNFQDEMIKGLNGKPSSLAMIPAHVGIHNEVPKDTLVAVIDAGGTNLRICKAYFDDDDRIHISCYSEQEMPGRAKEITAADFYKVLVDKLEPFQNEFQTIGFCFSYPADITSNLDGRLTHWTKEIKIPDMVDTHVGEGLMNALEERGVLGKRVVILNDTVACLLAGLAQGQTFHASSYVGFILGTGTNTAYVEKNENIRKKIDGNLDSGSSQVINVESGGFRLFERGPVDEQVDKESENPGSHLFEKAISGEYMGTITLKLLQALAKEDIFTNQGKATISSTKKLSNEHLSNLAAKNGKDTDILDTFNTDDCKIITTVYNAVVDRAALFTAVNICAAVIKSNAGTDADRPVCINIDGSTYELTFQMKEKAQRYLKEMTDARGLFIRYTEVNPDDEAVVPAPIVGAAIAGLTAFGEQ